MYNLSQSVAATQPTDNTVRVGTVVSLAPLVVNVQGKNFECSSIATVASGDIVSLIRQDQTWLVLGVVTPALFAGNLGTQRGLRGSGTGNFDSTTSTVTAVVPFGMTLPRMPTAIVTEIPSSAGSTARLVTRAYNYTTTGFTIFVYSTNAASFTVTALPFVWVAFL